MFPSAVKKAGERWQLGNEQLLVLDVRGDFVTLGLPASAGILNRHTRRRAGSRVGGPGMRSGYYWFPAGGPCMFVVSVQRCEPVALSTGYSIVAEDIYPGCVQLSCNRIAGAA